VSIARWNLEEAAGKALAWRNKGYPNRFFYLHAQEVRPSRAPNPTADSNGLRFIFVPAD
jgi:hypothetical protein